MVTEVDQRAHAIYPLSNIGSEIIYKFFLSALTTSGLCCGEYLNASDLHFSFFGKGDMEGIL